MQRNTEGDLCWYVLFRPLAAHPFTAEADAFLVHPGALCGPVDPWTRGPVTGVGYLVSSRLPPIWWIGGPVDP